MTPYSTPLLFWALAAAMTVAALVFVLRPLIARRSRAKHPAKVPLATSDVRRSHAVRAPATRRTGIAVAAALPLVALGLYAILGEPGALDPATGIDAEAAFGSTPVSTMRDDLGRHLARNPRDARGWVLLARLEFAADRYTDAADAFDRALAANPKVGNDPEIWCEYADALGMAQGGTLTGRPLEFVLRALGQNPAYPRALEMAGSASFEAGDYPMAVRYWRALAVQLAADSPGQRELDGAIARAELLGGTRAH